MKRHFPTSQPSQRSTMRGFSLIEVLVALLVLSIGLLGLAALQLMSLEANTNSLFRTQATIAAYDIVDRIRTNPTGFAATPNAYLVPDAATVATKLGTYGSCNTTTCNCETGTCDAANLALYDLAHWYDLLSKTLPGATNNATIRVIDLTKPTEITIHIQWTEKGTDRFTDWTVQL